MGSVQTAYCAAKSLRFGEGATPRLPSREFEGKHHSTRPPSLDARADRAPAQVPGQHSDTPSSHPDCAWQSPA